MIYQLQLEFHPLIAELSLIFKALVTNRLAEIHRSFGHVAANTVPLIKRVCALSFHPTLSLLPPSLTFLFFLPSLLSSFLFIFIFWVLLWSKSIPVFS
jgi:hypothetical protein